MNEYGYGCGGQARGTRYKDLETRRSRSLHLLRGGEGEVAPRAVGGPVANRERGCTRVRRGKAGKAGAGLVSMLLLPGLLCSLDPTPALRG